MPSEVTNGATGRQEPGAGGQVEALPPAWREFIRFCSELRHGEIERLSIQDGLPVLAETTRKKVKFNGDGQRRHA